MAQIESSIVFNNFPGSNSQVTADLLNDHVNNATLVSGAIADQVSSAPVGSDSILIQRTTSLFKATINQVIDLISSSFLLKSGGTMTGGLTLNGPPTSSNQAATKAYVDSTAISVPIGCIMMWGTVTPPTGWLELNGQASPPSLQALYGSVLPDMRGYFPRGWAAGSSAVDPQGATRLILSEQPHAMQTHTHNYTRTDGMTLFMTSGPNSITQIGGTSTQTTSTPTGNVSPIETRPVNRAVMFIVKYQ
jgi:hypothetical protein